MRPADLGRLLLLAAIWGASYLFMRIAVPHVGAEWMVEGRTLAGGLVLAAFLAVTRTSPAVARHWRGYLVLGALAVALPFWLIGTAVKTIDASTAAILNATPPSSRPSSPRSGSASASPWRRSRASRSRSRGSRSWWAGRRSP